MIDHEHRFTVIVEWLYTYIWIHIFSADRFQTIYSSDSDESYSDGEKSGRLMKAKKGGSDEVRVSDCSEFLCNYL